MNSTPQVMRDMNEDRVESRVFDPGTRMDQKDGHHAADQRLREKQLEEEVQLLQGKIRGYSTLSDLYKESKAMSHIYESHIKRLTQNLREVLKRMEDAGKTLPPEDQDFINELHSLVGDDGMETCRASLSKFKLKSRSLEPSGEAKNPESSKLTTSQEVGASDVETASKGSRSSGSSFTVVSTESTENEIPPNLDEAAKIVASGRSPSQKIHAMGEAFVDLLYQTSAKPLSRDLQEVLEGSYKSLLKEVQKIERENKANKAIKDVAVKENQKLKASLQHAETEMNSLRSEREAQTTSKKVCETAEEWVRLSNELSRNENQPLEVIPATPLVAATTVKGPPQEQPGTSTQMRDSSNSSSSSSVPIPSDVDEMKTEIQVLRQQVAIYAKDFKREKTAHEQVIRKYNKLVREYKSQEQRTKDANQQMKRMSDELTRIREATKKTEDKLKAQESATGSQSCSNQPPSTPTAVNVYNASPHAMMPMAWYPPFMPTQAPCAHQHPACCSSERPECSHSSPHPANVKSNATAKK